MPNESSKTYTTQSTQVERSPIHQKQDLNNEVCFYVSLPKFACSCTAGSLL